MQRGFAKRPRDYSDCMSVDAVLRHELPKTDMMDKMGRYSMSHVARTVPAPAPEPEQPFKLREIVETLPPREREPIIMHYYENTTQRDIARAKGVHHSEINRAIHSGINLLREMLGVA